MTLILRFSYPSIWKSISRYMEVYISIILFHAIILNVIE